METNSRNDLWAQQYNDHAGQLTPQVFETIGTAEKPSKQDDMVAKHATTDCQRRIFGGCAWHTDAGQWQRVLLESCKEAAGGHRLNAV
eukprot:6486634-Amphidinium_carterae.1